jgi:hypothetical protein
LRGQKLKHQNAEKQKWISACDFLASNIDTSPGSFLKMKFHPQALVDPGAIVGARTRVWAFAHVRRPSPAFTLRALRLDSGA